MQNVPQEYFEAMAVFLQDLNPEVEEDAIQVTKNDQKFLAECPSEALRPVLIFRTVLQDGSISATEDRGIVEAVSPELSAQDFREAIAHERAWELPNPRRPSQEVEESITFDVISINELE